MLRRKRRSGMTLIEILLSLIVLTLGVLGILSLFPPALQMSKESVEATQSAILAEGIASALVSSMQFGKHNAGPPATFDITLTHDLMWPRDAPTAVSRYSFQLPDVTEGWRHHPSALPKGSQMAPGDEPRTMEYFRVCGDGWVGAAIDDVRRKNDSSETYRQWAFSFDIAKIDEHMEYLIGEPNPDNNNLPYTAAELEPLIRLYEFQIHIFRESTQGGVWGGGTGVETPGTTSAQHIATYTKRVSIK